MLDIATMSTSTKMAKNYSNCPLKKRPINFIVKDENVVSIPIDLAVSVPTELTKPISPKPVKIEVKEEPENLSTKPEDLSLRASVYPKVESPPEATTPVSAPVVINSMSIPAPVPRWGGAFQRVTPSSPEPLHYAPTTWHRSVASTPHYPSAYFPLGYHPYPSSASELYHPYPLYPSPPSPYAPRDNSCSPPQMPLPRTPLAPLPILPLSPAASLSPGSSLRSHSPTSSTEPADLSPPPTIAPASAVHMRSNVNSANSARHQCPDCGKSYSTFSGLSKHRQFHCAAGGDGPRRSFSCKYCEKVYVSLGALKMHIRTHTLPCKCTLCGKAFSRPWLLQGHIRTHTGEKPFSCQHCHRAFADRSNLRAHLQTHSDVKKYSCTTCSKTFSRMSLLTKHAEGGCGGASVNSSSLYSINQKMDHHHSMY